MHGGAHRAPSVPPWSVHPRHRRAVHRRAWVRSSAPAVLLTCIDEHPVRRWCSRPRPRRGAGVRGAAGRHRPAVTACRALRAVPPHHVHQHVDNRSASRAWRPRPAPAARCSRSVGARHHGDRHIRDRGIAELRAPELVAAQPRHLQIEQHEARRRPARGGGRCAAGAAPRGRPRPRRHETLRRQQRREHLPGVRVVFDDEDIAGGRVACRLRLISSPVPPRPFEPRLHLARRRRIVSCFYAHDC